MTNSEEPSAPDSLKVSETFSPGAQELSHPKNHQVPVSNGEAPLPHDPTPFPAPVAVQHAETDPFPASLPFSLICSEEIEHKTETSDGGVLVLTSYRLFLQTKDNCWNVPLGLIESVEARDIFFLLLNCKDARSIRVTFPNNEATLEMLKRIQVAMSLSQPKKAEEMFAFSFFENTTKVDSGECEWEVRAQLGLDLPSFPTPKERFDAEVKRMEFNVQGPWRVSDENKDYELCGSYPTHIIVPCVMDKRKLEQVACFRSARRFPAVVWRHKGNGAVISRCSQPEVGWFGWRSNEDEELVQNIVLACADNGRGEDFLGQAKNLSGLGSSKSGQETAPSSSPPSSPGAFNSLSSMEVVPEPPNTKKLLILDARSYSTAVVNRARGGGCECLEYYTSCEIQFMNLANIHSIRKSFINVRQLCSLPADQANSNWYSQLESSKWLQHMSGLMKAAITVATAIENEGRPVMVHCSDGWDRTPQIVALAEILLDPYYRSLEGFQVLVEREWLDFGHKFADRCGQGVGSEDTNERCPVFLQWLDCLHQLLLQFPSAFEFNMTFLVKLAQHTYSNLFGTFLCNTAKERQVLGVYSSTHSIWRFLRAPANYYKFRNHLYSNCDQVLWPSCEVRVLKLWSQVYLGFDNPTPTTVETVHSNLSQESSPAPSVAADCERNERFSNHKLEQTKVRSSSCENLHMPHAGNLQRRKSDPSLSDSVLGIESDDSEPPRRRCSERLEAAETTSTTVQNTATNIDSPQEREMTNLSLVADGEDVSENEEPNSEEKSESTVINLKYLKSIESSTDTLVPEVTTGVQNFILEETGKTDGETDIARKTEMEKCESNKPLTDSLGKDQSSGELDPVAQCEVCVTSRRLLKNEVPISMGQGTTTTTTSSSSGTSSTLSSVTVFAEGNSSNMNGSGSGSKFSSYNTPMHSRTPSTGVPGTPEELQPQSGKNVLQNAEATVKTKSSFYDVDGLEPLHDEVQSRVTSIISGYKAKIDNLQKELQMYRDALMRQVCHKCTHHFGERPDDVMSVADSLCSVEHQSVGHESHSSEISWEAVDEKDTRPPLWLPDFAVTKCMGCEATFWLGKRKHHCRACGKIFCADCSEHAIPIPNEQYFTPVRVCSTCFYRSNYYNGINGSSLTTSSSPSSSSFNPMMNGSCNGNGYGHHVNGVESSLPPTEPSFHHPNLKGHHPKSRLSDDVVHKKHSVLNGGTGGVKLKTFYSGEDTDRDTNLPY